jgi:hypothetical protein
VISASRTAARQGILVPAIEEVPRISDAERVKLRASLDKARKEIAEGDYDVLTPELLRAEFDAIYREGKSDAEVDATLAKRSRRRSKQS